jgi:hypothetical protein
MSLCNDGLDGLDDDRLGETCVVVVVAASLGAHIILLMVIGGELGSVVVDTISGSMSRAHSVNRYLREDRLSERGR